MGPCPREFLEFSCSLADVGGEIQRRFFRKSFRVEVKADGSSVTQVDLETEAVVRAMLEKRYPTHGIIGEEYPPVRTDAEVVWLVDPVDGTESLVAGIPLFGFMLALAVRGHFVLGLIEQPILRDRWIGADGYGTTLNGRRVRSRPCGSLAEAVVYTDGPMLARTVKDDAIARVCGACRRFRYGVECYTFGVLASGYLDAVVDYGLDVYDFAPLEPVVRNAGGALTDWEGAPLRIDSKGGAVLGAGDLRVLAQAVEKLSGSEH